MSDEAKVRANEGVPDEFLTRAEVVCDIRMRLKYAPAQVGDDTRALPPVDWARVDSDGSAEVWPSG